MEVKLLEVRDRLTFIPVIAMSMISRPGLVTWETQSMAKSVMAAHNARLYYLQRRCGYTQDERHPTILLTKLDGGQKAYADPYAWGDRTYQVAHLYITEHWHDLKDGDVVDVEFILGETKEPKVSEIAERLL